MAKVLIIEDDKSLRDIYALILEKEGFTVDKAENGKVGLSKLKVFKPDLITLDMLMPIMGGVEFLKAANLVVRYPNAKTIIVSNLSEAISESDFPKYGVVCSCLKADLSPGALASVVKQYCL